MHMFVQSHNINDANRYKINKMYQNMEVNELTQLIILQSSYMSSNPVQWISFDMMCTHQSFGGVWNG